MSMKTSPPITPLLLVVLDGWGYSEGTVYNAIHSAHTPTWDRLWARCPHALIEASGIEVGLPARQMGNSEVGHMHIGAGRLLDQEFTRISRTIEEGSFYNNALLRQRLEALAGRDAALHVLGLMSTGGVHGHEDHMLALVRMAARHGVKRVYLHAFMDGRDTLPRCAEESIQQVLAVCGELGTGRIASLVGRYYAMDRNCNWERTREAYELIAHGHAQYRCTDPLLAIRQAYDRGECDEFIKATAICEAGCPVTVCPGDLLVSTNFRADRVRQLTRAFTEHNFAGFARGAALAADSFITFTRYDQQYTLPTVYPHETPADSFGECVSRAGLRQLRIAETEKYAHVTFFFNGGEERVYAGEDRILVPSPDVPTYDQCPEMSAYAVADKLTQAIRTRNYHAIICNFANADMVGHTGDFHATIKAVQVLDDCLSGTVAACRDCGYDLVITADHGNAEQLGNYINEKQPVQPHKAHTVNPVPFVYCGRDAVTQQTTDGSLRDVAPTLLYLMGLPIPTAMTGRRLVQLSSPLQRGTTARVAELS